MMMEGEYYRQRGGKLTKVPALEDAFEGIRIRVEDLKEKNERLQKKIDELEEENWKDRELQLMKEEYDQMRKERALGFPMTEEEVVEVKNWQKQHELESHPLGRKATAIGGRYCFEFTPTSIGIFGTCYCQACRAAGRENAGFIFQEESA